MTVCSCCQTIEPRTREATEAELREVGLEPDAEMRVCAECDSLDELVHVREREAYDD